MRGFKIFAVLCVVIIAVGCGRLQNKLAKQEIPDNAKQDLAKPVNCLTAQEDIQVLESEKVSSTDQLKSGVKMFVPASAAVAILKGQYLDRGEVATGQYNADLDKKIQEIKTTCGIK